MDCRDCCTRYLPRCDPRTGLVSQAIMSANPLYSETYTIVDKDYNNSLGSLNDFQKAAFSTITSSFITALSNDITIKSQLVTYARFYCFPTLKIYKSSSYNHDYSNLILNIATTVAGFLIAYSLQPTDLTRLHNLLLKSIQDLSANNIPCANAYMMFLSGPLLSVPDGFQLFKNV